LGVKFAGDSKYGCISGVVASKAAARHARRRRRGLDFLVQWLPEKHPEYCRE